MFMNWETLPTFLCFVLGLVLLVQYFSSEKKTIMLCGVGYFLTLFFSGISEPLFEISGFFIRNISLCLLLTMVLLTYQDWAKRWKLLIKIPLFILLLSWYFRGDMGKLLMIEGVVGFALGYLLWLDRKAQGVRFRYFIKSTILGIIYIMFKRIGPHWAFQSLALLFKLGATYYLYCWVNTYLAENFLKKVKR